MKRLLGVLGLKRGHGSAGEAEFIRTFLLPYEPKAFVDDKGEVMAYLIVTDPESKVLFSCHTDTVHRSNDTLKGEDILNPILNPVQVEDGFAFKGDETPLGADDGAGIWLMLEMIDAGIPGSYAFHRGEERFGIGSSWMAHNESEFLSKFNFAIAFDRRGQTDVITHQGGKRGCSDEFALELATMLPKGLEPCSEGIFTDTAHYFTLIPECTNVSVGYEREHSALEYLDIGFLFDLRDALIQNFDETRLPVVRSCIPMIENEDDVRNADWEEVVAWVARSDPYDVTNLLKKMAWELEEFAYKLDDANLVLDAAEDRLDYLKAVDF